MKEFVLVPIIMSTLFSTAQTTAIPDPDFETYLVVEGFDTDGMINGQILTSDALSVDTMIINGSINSFTGLEDFSNLKYFTTSGFMGTTINLQGTISLDFLSVSFSNTSSILFDQNQQLTHLKIFESNINYLDLSNCPLLEFVQISISPLDSIDITGNPLLKILEINRGQLIDINLANNSKLTNLNLTSNEIQNLNIGHLDSLKILGVGSNKILELDVSNNALLTMLFCDTNQIEKLDLSQNPLLSFFYGNNNNLNELNLQNGSNHLIFSFSFKAENNPNLTCIQVDSVNYSNNTWTSIDAQSYFSTYCMYDLGVKDLKTQPLRLFPNPAANEFTIQLPEAIQQGSLIVYNAMGQMVLKKSMVNQRDLQININQPAGFYIVKVKTIDYVYTAQLVIQ